MAVGYGTSGPKFPTVRSGSPWGEAIGALSSRILSDLAAEAKQAEVLRKEGRAERLIQEEREYNQGMLDEATILEDERTQEKRQYESQKEASRRSWEQQQQSQLFSHQTGMKEMEYTQADKVTMQKFALAIAKGDIESARNLKAELQTIDARKDADVELKNLQNQFDMGKMGVKESYKIAGEKRAQEDKKEYLGLVEQYKIDAEERQFIDDTEKALTEASIEANKALQKYTFETQEDLKTHKRELRSKADERTFKVLEAELEGSLEAGLKPGDKGYDKWYKNHADLVDEANEFIKVSKMTDSEQLAYYREKKKLEDVAKKKKLRMPNKKKPPPTSIFDGASSATQSRPGLTGIEAQVAARKNAGMSLQEIQTDLKKAGVSSNKVKSAFDSVDDVLIKIKRNDFSSLGSITPQEKAQLQALVGSRASDEDILDYLQTHQIPFTR